MGGDGKWVKEEKEEGSGFKLGILKMLKMVLTAVFSAGHKELR